MIESFFKNREVIVQLKAASFGPCIDYYAEYLHRHRCSSSVAKNHLQVAGHFCYWLKNEHTPLGVVNETSVGKFLSKHLKECSCPIARRRILHSYPPALRYFLKVLRDHHLIAPAQNFSTPVSPMGNLLLKFVKHLVDVHGVTLPTVRNYSSYVREFLKTKYRSGQIDLKKIDANDVREYVFAKASAYKPKTIKRLAASLRAFFRFLAITNEITSSLENTVPTVPERILSTLPKYLTDEDLQSLFSCFDLSKSTGLRNRAMALLMARVGLRSCEVAQLTLDNVNWREGTIQIEKSKSHYASSLPLPKEVGQALVDYIRKGRPPSKERHIFLTHIFPAGRPLLAAPVSTNITRALKHSCLRVRPCGSHTLRHTLATQLLRKGATLKEIADLLRHRSIETTNIYAKVDLKKLAEVALPWPEVKP